MNNQNEMMALEYIHYFMHIHNFTETNTLHKIQIILHTSVHACMYVCFCIYKTGFSVKRQLLEIEGIHTLQEREHKNCILN